MLLCRRAFVLQVWQVAYIVLARQAWKHYGEGMIPSLKLHYEGLTELIDWFDRHADPEGAPRGDLIEADPSNLRRTARRLARRFQ